MKDSQEYLLFKTIELRHSPCIEDLNEPNHLEEGTCRSFTIKFNIDFDRISILIHFKHLRINNLTLHYRRKSAKNRKLKKVYPQHKMKLFHDNTLDLLTYLSKKNYTIDWFEIRFKNGWVIQDSFLNSLEFITNNTEERNQLFDKLISLSGQGPIDINSLEINETYSLLTNGQVKIKPFLGFPIS